MNNFRDAAVSDFVVFIGVGASVPFGIPAMTDRAQGFDARLEAEHPTHLKFFRFPVPIADLRYQFEYFPGTNRVKSLELVVTTADGVKREIGVRPLNNTYHLLTGGYLGGYKGWLHGKWMGPYAIDGEKLDLADPRVLEDLGGGVDDTLCEFKCGNDVGYGILESFVIVA